MVRRIVLHCFITISLNATPQFDQLLETMKTAEKTQNFASLELLLKKQEFKHAVNEYDNSGNTLLLYAVEFNEPYEIVKLLLNNNANPNRAQQDTEITPLEAVLLDLAGSIEGSSSIKIINALKKVLLLLLEKGSNPNLYSYSNPPLLYTAVSTDDIEIISALINYGIKINAPPSRYAAGNVLPTATWRGNYAIVKLLIASGILINTPETKNTALVQAATHYTYKGISPFLRDSLGKIILLLLKHGAIQVPAFKELLKINTALADLINTLQPTNLEEQLVQLNLNLTALKI